MDESNVEELLTQLNEGTHKFNDLSEKMSFSRATVSKYLKQLKELDLVKKDMTNDERIGWFITDRGREALESNIVGFAVSDFKVEDALERSRKENEAVKYLETQGYFSEGIDGRNIIKFLNKFSELHSYDKDSVWFKKEGDIDSSLSAEHLKAFIDTVDRLLGSNHRFNIREMEGSGSAGQYERDIDLVREFTED